MRKRLRAALLAAILCLVMAPALLAATVSRKDIVDTAIAAGDFNTLVAAIQAAGLEEALRQPHSYTVFAPTDEAFAKLPPGVLENLLKPENKDQLVQILTYHVIYERRIVSTAIRRRPMIRTMQGGMLHIHRARDMIMVNDARIIMPDITTKNGIIHAIDEVLIPE